MLDLSFVFFNFFLCISFFFPRVLLHIYFGKRAAAYTERFECGGGDAEEEERRPVVFVRSEPDSRGLITIKSNEALYTPVADTHIKHIHTLHTHARARAPAHTHTYSHAHGRDKGHPNDIYAANK